MHMGKLMSYFTCDANEKPLRLNVVMKFHERVEFGVYFKFKKT